MQSVLRMDIDKMDMSMEIKTEALPNSLFAMGESSNECKELLRTFPGKEIGIGCIYINTMASGSNLKSFRASSPLKATPKHKTQTSSSKFFQNPVPLGSTRDDNKAGWGRGALQGEKSIGTVIDLD